MQCILAVLFLVGLTGAEPCEGVCPIVVVPECAEEFHRPPNRVHLTEYEAPPFTLEFVDLELDLRPQRTLVTAELSFAGYNRTRDLALHGHPSTELLALEIEEPGHGLRTQDTALQHACRTKDGGLVFKPAAFDSDRFKIKTRVSIEPSANTELFGLYQSGDLLVTQNEAEGFRRITFFPDRPDVLAVYRTTLRADKEIYPVLLSNGNLVSRSGGDRHEATFLDPHPKPSYLFAAVAGNLKHVAKDYDVGRPCAEAVAAFYEVDVSQARYQPLHKFCTPDVVATPPQRRQATIRVWSTPENVDRLHWALLAVEKAMLWDEIAYGRFYDLDEFHVVAVNDFNAGAMENKGLNIFNAALLEANSNISTDNQFLRVRTVVAHEYFHNWSGDRITLRDWFQLSLKEGFTVFRDQSFSRDVLNSSITRLEDASFMETVQFAEDASALRHPIRPEEYQSIENFYTTTVYEKGAEVVRMYETLLGWKAFRQGTDRYFASQDGKAATCEDFFQAMQSVTPQDISQFKRWYHQVGTPMLTISEQRWDQDRQTFRFRVSQEVYSGGPLMIPLSCGLVGLASHEPITEATFLLTNTTQEFEFSGVSEQPVLAVNRGFGAPVLVKPYLSREEMELLSAYDPCSYIRWKTGRQALQTVVLDEISNETSDIELPVRLLEAILLTVREDTGDRATKSMELGFPTVESYESLVAEFDPARILLTTRRLRKLVARKLEDQLWQTFEVVQREANTQKGLTASVIGTRKLRTAILAQLAATGNSRALMVLENMLRHADSEEEASSALYIAANLEPSGKRDLLLNIYRARAGDEPMLVDRWFAAQASSGAPDTLDRVKQLMKLTEYAKSQTPNRIRSLLGSLSRNQPIFHGGAGESYDLLAAEVLRIDKFNPKVAARLVTAFSASPKLPSGRKAMIRGRVQQLLDEASISKQSREILTKTLAEL